MQKLNNSVTVIQFQNDTIKLFREPYQWICFRQTIKAFLLPKITFFETWEQKNIFTILISEL